MKQLTLFPELDLSSKEPIQYDGSSGQFFNKFVEKPGPMETALNNVIKKPKSVPVRKPNAVPPKTKTIQKFQNGGAPKKTFRPENMSERIERLTYIYDGNVPKPKHFDNPNIIDTENYKKMPKKFDNNDPSTYPSDRDQKQRLNTWDLILDTTIKSGTPEEKKEMRSYLREKYNDPDQRKHLGKKELRFISAYKDPKETIAKAPITTPSVIPTFNPIQVPEPDPRSLELERRYRQIVEEGEREKQRNRTSGLAGLLGIK
jgi:hypothetical protein